jgi:hypothetical protein
VQDAVPRLENLKDELLHRLKNGITHDDEDLQRLFDWIEKDGRALAAAQERFGNHAKDDDE